MNKIKEQQFELFLDKLSMIVLDCIPKNDSVKSEPKEESMREIEVA
ncbi:hypothetical protein OCA21_19645 [Bacillus cereus]|nr:MULTISPECIES: hypothetical protein [Bacillus]MBJ8061889.1 hypothetical protein [Bacillus cereus]MCU5108022.1 hypothetical protein [Bacillus cereus]HDR7686073.1 hypothetical protein [Bacillus toyonensis]